MRRSLGAFVYTSKQLLVPFQIGVQFNHLILDCKTLGSKVISGMRKVNHKLNETSIDTLMKFGWHPGRNVFDRLIIPVEKKLFPEAQRIIGEYGLLEIEFAGREPSHPIEQIYFDVDESRKSQVFRAQMWGFETPEEVDYEENPDFSITEDYKLSALISKKVGLQCCYIGFHEEYLGLDIFVAEDGLIYVTHHEDPIKAADSFEEYLNKCIIGNAKPISSIQKVLGWFK